MYVNIIDVHIDIIDVYIDIYCPSIPVPGFLCIFLFATKKLEFCFFRKVGPSPKVERLKVHVPEEEEFKKELQGTFGGSIIRGRLTQNLDD